MYCSKCGKKIDEDSRFCEDCGSPITTLDAKKAEVPNIGHWSWGGAVMTFWYAIGMKFRFWWVLLIVLYLILSRGLTSSQNTLIIGFIFFLIMFLYIGFNARKWAWKTRKWDNLEQFLAVQRTWDIWGIAVIVLAIAVGFLSNL